SGTPHEAATQTCRWEWHDPARPSATARMGRRRKVESGRRGTGRACDALGKGRADIISDPGAVAADCSSPVLDVGPPSAGGVLLLLAIARVDALHHRDGSRSPDL